MSDAKVKIVWSTCRTLFYILAPNRTPNEWLGVKEEGPVPADKKAGALDGYVQLEYDGETYHRRVAPFAFWKVKSLPAEEISVDDLKCVDYAQLARWHWPPDERDTAFEQVFAKVADLDRQLADLRIKLRELARL